MKTLNTTNSSSAISLLAIGLLSILVLMPHPLSAQLPNDVGIVNVVSPTTQCNLEEEIVEVTLFNFGDNPQSLIPFRFSVNGQDPGVMQPSEGFYTGVLGPDSTVTIAFETTYDFSVEGIYNVAAWTELSTDMDLSNDTFYYEVENIQTITEAPYVNNFDVNEGGWLIDELASTNNTWAFGMPNGPDIDMAASGDLAWVTNLDGNYSNNELSYLQSPCMDFSDFADDPVFGCAIYYDTETSWDGAWLEATIDGGLSWFKVGEMGTGTNWYNFNNTTTGLGEVWAGNSNGWLIAETPLTGFAGESAVRFRFVFDSDGSVNNFDGIGIDDIYILVPLANDLGATGITNLSTELCGSEMDQLAVNIKNFGTDAQSGFDVSYQIDNDPVITENVGSLTVPAGETVTYTFDETFNTNVFNTTFAITTWTSLPGELNAANDTAMGTVLTLFPEVLPLITDFEQMVTPPGWFNSDNLVGIGHNNLSYVAYDNLYIGDQSFELISPITGPINPGDSLTFDYRYTDFSAGTVATTLGNGDVLAVAISTDCGDSFTTVFTIDQNNHIPSNVMTNSLVDLNDYAGEYIQIRFQASWGTGDYWLDIDNINIIGCPVDLALGAAISSVSTSGASDGSATVVPAQGQAPYTYDWSNGDNTGTITDVAAGSYTVTVTDANGCMDVLTVEVGTCPESFDLSAAVTGTSSETTNDGKITLTINGGTAPYTISWSNGNSGANISGLPVGEYTVTVVDVNGCTDELTVTLGVAVSTVEVSLIDKFQLAPTPTTGQTAVTVALTRYADYTITVINPMGQMLWQQDEQHSTGDRHLLDLSGLANGIYFIQINIVGGKGATQKIIKI